MTFCGNESVGEKIEDGVDERSPAYLDAVPHYIDLLELLIDAHLRGDPYAVD